jgi:hypothetical protein
MKQTLDEPLDHELHRIPVTRSMKLQVKAARGKLQMPEAVWLRMVIAQALDQGK